MLLFLDQWVGVFTGESSALHHLQQDLKVFPRLLTFVPESRKIDVSLAEAVAQHRRQQLPRSHTGFICFVLSVAEMTYCVFNSFIDN